MHIRDLRIYPDAVREWEFAAAVLRHQRHPMSWLLGWAGIRAARRPAPWDRFLLVATAAFVVILSILGGFTLSALTDGQNMVWKWILWVAGGCVYAVLMTLLYFAVRQFEVRQQEREIERYRSNLPVGGSAHTYR